MIRNDSVEFPELRGKFHCTYKFRTSVSSIKKILSNRASRRDQFAEMRIGVGPTRKKKKKKISNQEGKGKKKEKKKRNKRGKEFSRCTSNQIVLTISSEIPPGNNGKSH